MLDEKPSCFAKHWDPKAVVCKGGLDPTYQGENGHVRERCELFAPCGARTQAAKISNLVPPENLVRPKEITKEEFTVPRTINVPAPPVVYVDRNNQPMREVPREVTQAVPQQVQMMPVNYAMPTYLSVNEDRKEGEGIFPMLMRTLLRGSIKGAAHALAHLVDITPIFKK